MVGSEWNPGRLLATSSSYWQACTIHAAVKLNLFSALEEEQAPSAGLAGRLALDDRALDALLNSLVAMDLLGRDGSEYRNTDFSRQFLVQGSKHYLGYMILHHRHLGPDFVNELADNNRYREVEITFALHVYAEAVAACLRWYRRRRR